MAFSESSTKPPATGSKPGWRAVLSIVLLAVLLAAAAWYVIGHREEVLALRHIQFQWLLITGGAFAFNMILRSVFALQVLKYLDVKLSFWESFGLSSAGMMMNLLLPVRPGAGFRAVYLRQRHDLSYPLFVGSLAALNLFFMVVSSAIGIVALVIIASHGAPASRTLTVTLTAILVLGLLAVVFPGKAAAIPHSGFLHQCLDGWRRICRSRSLLITAAVTLGGCTLFAVIGIYSAFLAFDVRMDTPGAVLITASQQLGGLVSLTPGAVGIQELLGVYFASSLSITVTETVVVLAAVRVVKVITAVIIGMPGFVILTRKLKRQVPSTH